MRSSVSVMLSVGAVVALLGGQIVSAQTTTTLSASTSEPAPAISSTESPTAPAPESTTGSTPFHTTTYRRPGTCCKQKNEDGTCASLSVSNPDLYFDHYTEEGSDNWCNVPECGCGLVGECVEGEFNCGFNGDDPEPCTCDAECYLDGRCCIDFYDVCAGETTEGAEVPAPAPSTTTETTTTTTTTTTTVEGATRPPAQPAPSQRPPTVTVDPPDSNINGNTTDLEDPENNVAVIASVTVVVIVVVALVVIFSVRHIKKQQQGKALFVSTGESDTPTRDVELSTRAKSYEYSGKGRRSSKKAATTARENPRTYLGASVVKDGDNDDTGGSSASSGRRSRRSKSKTPKGKSPKSKSPASTTHEHDDVFASPTHQNFEL